MPEIQLDLSQLESAINPKFYPYLTNKDRYLVLYGGAGSGKSIFVGQKLLLRIIMGMKQGIKHKFLCLRKQMPAARKSIYSQFQNTINDWGLSDICKSNKMDMNFMFDNGSEIIVGGLDDPEKLKSIYGVTSVWLEECTEMTKDDFRQVDLRLRGQTKSYKQIILSFNPISKMVWIYNEFFEKRKESAALVHSTYKDNIFLDQEYVKTLEALKDEDPTYYKIYTLGEWGVLSDSVYNKYEVIDNFPEDIKYYDDFAYGLDFGFNSPTSLIFVGEKDNEFFIKEHLYDTKLTNNMVIDRLQGIIPEKMRSKSIIYADYAEPARIKEINSAGFFCKQADKDIDNGVDYVKRRNLKINKDSTNVIKEIGGYAYRKDNNGITVDVPIKFNDHAMDAMRYAIWTHWGRLRPKASILII